MKQRFHFDLLSKKAREEWVTVLIHETDEESDIVRVQLREIPEAEFSVLEATFSGALNAASRLAREVSKTEAKLHEERLRGAGDAATLASLKKAIAGYKEAREDLQALRREIVSKSVIAHDPEYFEMDHLPMEGDTIAAEAKASLLALGFTDEQVTDGFRQGFIRVPFVAQSWTYGEGAQALTLPGASEETVRLYERLQPESALLNSLCNAVFYWHRLALKPATSRKEELKEARLSRSKQREKIEVLRRHGLIKEESIVQLLALDAKTFDLVAGLLLNAVELKAKQWGKPTIEISLNPQ